jgi:hypothetical protein
MNVAPTSDVSTEQLGLHGTFTPNKIESIHRWYPYLEGFSSTFVETTITRWANLPVKSIYDPFGGTGTAMTVAAVNGYSGFYSEINPFMRHVIECKTNILKKVAFQSDELNEYFQTVLKDARALEISEFESKEKLAEVFPGKPYFSSGRLVEILSIKESINQSASQQEFKSLALLALASIGVDSSDMKRQTDLRYRTPKEALAVDYSVRDAFHKKCKQITQDIEGSYSKLKGVRVDGANAMYSTAKKDYADFIITSPPYLNGTNYFRNTKIELWLAGFIEHESELGAFTREAMIAGINNVSKLSRPSREYNFVERIATKLDSVAYDKRIPSLVRGYATDTELWLENCQKKLKAGSRLVIDIGDSKFAGIHVPTDEFILEIAKMLGFKHVATEMVRARKSKDGSTLKQVLLILEKRGE